MWHRHSCAARSTGRAWSINSKQVRAHGVASRRKKGKFLLDKLAEALRTQRQQHAEEAPLPRPPAKQNLKGSKPNIFILFGDDIGHGDLNIFGHPTSTTPWLDKMASE